MTRLGGEHGRAGECRVKKRDVPEALSYLLLTLGHVP